jgi:hypothetical protein
MFYVIAKNVAFKIELLLIFGMMLLQTEQRYRVLEVYGSNVNDKTYQQQMKLLNADTLGLKDRDIVIKSYLPSSSFKIVLRGKDGGVKFTDTKLLPLAKLYAIIDAMPMRQEEMRIKAKRKPTND